MSEPKIKIKNLYKIFGKNPLQALERVQEGVGKDELLEKHNHVLGLKDINLDVHAQSIQVVMGLSGSGKSTLIRHINRLIDPTSGSVSIDGDEVLKMNEEELRNFRRNKTAMVFQRFALLPHKTVLENAIFGPFLQNIDEKEAKQRAMRWIERVGLSGYENKFPQHLSGGMQQRVGLARALTNDGDILLMDEAFSALDPLIRKDMQDILLELQDELHKTVVFITHDLDEALKLGDRIAILKDGVMDQEGIPADILLNPQTQYVKDFVEDVNRARVIKAKHIMSDLNGQDLNGAMPINQDEFIDRFIDKVIAEKPENLVIQDKDNNNVGFLSTKRLSEILKR
jgi:glycine betaine/proline transport system ATP-binding protein